MAHTLSQRRHLLLARRELGAGVFVLRFERHSLDFIPGQYLIVGKNGSIHRREYSIYSGPNDDYLEILLKEIPSGLVSPALHNAPIGTPLAIEGPFGYFTIPEDARTDAPHIMVATGTGIAPFRSFVEAYPRLDCRIAHGVRSRDQRYEHHSYPPARYTACLSGDENGDYNGRVTAWLSERQIAEPCHYWLCGNSNMIYEIHDILVERGVDATHIMAEVYF